LHEEKPKRRNKGGMKTQEDDVAFQQYLDQVFKGDQA
jgi:hypothetical protein